MPATDSSSSSPATHTSFGRSILSLRCDQIHFPPPPADHHASTNSDHEIDTFQRHAADLLLNLLPSDASHAAPEILSLAWTRHLLDSFLICLEEFCSILFGYGGAALAWPLLYRLVNDFFDRTVKALDLCNSLRNGVDLIRLWRKHLAIANLLFALLVEKEENEDVEIGPMRRSMAPSRSRRHLHLPYATVHRSAAVLQIHRRSPPASPRRPPPPSSFPTEQYPSRFKIVDRLR